MVITVRCGLPGTLLLLTPVLVLLVAVSLSSFLFPFWFPAAADVALATTKLPLHSITTGPDDMAIFDHLLCLLSMLMMMITGACLRTMMMRHAYVRVASGGGKHTCMLRLLQ